MNTKRFLAIVLCGVMLLCAAGCNQEPAPVITTPTITTPDVAGVLFVSIGAEFRIVYDTNGNVLAADSLTHTAADVIIAQTDLIGIPCKQLVRNLIKDTIAAGKHPYNRVVVIKQASGSSVPSPVFLEEVRLDAVAATDYEVVLIAADALTDEGYITQDAAKDILTRQLKLTDVTMNCSELWDNFYTLTFELEGAEQEYNINASTGTVVLESLPSDLLGPGFDDYDDGEYEGDDSYEIDDSEAGPQD